MRDGCRKIRENDGRPAVYRLTMRNFTKVGFSTIFCRECNSVILLNDRLTSKKLFSSVKRDNRRSWKGIKYSYIQDAPVLFLFVKTLSTSSSVNKKRIEDAFLSKNLEESSLSTVNPNLFFSDITPFFIINLNTVNSKMNQSSCAPT